MRIIVTDVNGNNEERIAYSDKYRGGYDGGFTKQSWSDFPDKKAFWAIVGVGSAIVFIPVIVAIFCGMKQYKGYRTTRTG